MDTHKDNPIVRTFEEGGTKKEFQTLDAWREEVRQAGSESKTAYGDFLESLFFYYGELQRAREGKVVRKALQEEWIGAQG